MIRSGNPTDNNNVEVSQTRSLEPGVVILAEIAFATLLLYLASQPANIINNVAVVHAVDQSEIASTTTVTDRKIGNTIPAIKLVSETAEPANGTDTDFKSASGVAVASTNISATDALASN